MRKESTNNSLKKEVTIMIRKNDVKIELEDVLKAGMYNYTQKDIKRLEALKRRENKKQRNHVFIKRVLTAVGISYVMMFNLGGVVEGETINPQNVQESQSNKVQAGQPRESSQKVSQSSQSSQESSNNNNENSQSQVNNDVSHETQNKKQNNSVSHETNDALKPNLHESQNRAVSVHVDFIYKGKTVAHLADFTYNPYEFVKNHPAVIGDDRIYKFTSVLPPKGYKWSNGSTQMKDIIIDVSKGSIIYYHEPVIPLNQKVNNSSVSHETQNVKQNKKVSHETPNVKQNKKVSHETPNKEQNVLASILPQTNEGKTNLSIVGIGLLGVVTILLGVLGIKKGRK